MASLELAWFGYAALAWVGMAAICAGQLHRVREARAFRCAHFGGVSCELQEEEMANVGGLGLQNTVYAMTDNTAFIAPPTGDCQY